MSEPTGTEPGRTVTETDVTEPASGTVAVPDTTTTTPPPRRAPVKQHSRTSGLWVGLILSAVVLLFLLIFILQNLEPVRIQFLGLDGTLPTGVALLLGAIAGILLVAIPGSARIVQLRRVAKRETKRVR
jgi:lipopolysaccharide assembly protein A